MANHGFVHFACFHCSRVKGLVGGYQTPAPTPAIALTPTTDPDFAPAPSPAPAPSYPEYPAVQHDHDHTRDVERAQGRVDDKVGVVETTELLCFSSTWGCRRGKGGRWGELGGREWGDGGERGE